MNEFVTWTSLGTYAGAVMMVTLITQFIKQLKFMENVNSQLISYVVAVLLLLGSLCFSHSGEVVNPETVILCFVNAITVALGSNGIYDGVTTGLEKIKNEDDGKYIHEEE
jgi:hypothetical protein